MQREFDIIVYGASGLAGKYIIAELLKHNVNFAVSGRSEKRIKENIESLPNSNNLVIKEVNVENTKKLNDLISSTKILLNCAGPYIYSGEIIVDSCLRNGTHYIDISGETFFIQNCIEKFNETAMQKNIYIINCAGFDSIPADIGVDYLKNILLKEEKEFKSIEIESVLILENTYINKTTYDCAVYGFGLSEKTKKMRNKNVEKKKNNSKKVKKLFYDKEIKSYCAIFPGTDASVVRRSQQELEKKGENIQTKYYAYVKIGGMLKTLMVIFIGLIFSLFSRFSLGRYFLLKFPMLFTFGYIKSKRPTKKQIHGGSFKFFFKGTGITENGTISKKMILSGPDPGYITTAICITECSILLLEIIENNQKDSKADYQGGVLTPATVFRNSDLVERLKINGLKFDLVGDFN